MLQVITCVTHPGDGGLFDGTHPYDGGFLLLPIHGRMGIEVVPSGLKG